MTSANPFVRYGTIASDERFVGRGAERAALRRLGKSGGHLVVVLDEFDKIKHFPDAREFLSLLRELVYHPDRIPMAALAVARCPIDRIEVQAADVSTFAGVCDSIYLRP